MKLALLLIIVIIIGAGGYFLFKGGRISFSPTPSLLATQTATGEKIPTPSKEQMPDVIHITMTTARGDIKLDLYPKVAPKTVLNFIKLAQEGFYNGTKFHRVVPDFVIQGGDPLSRTDDPKVGTGGPGYAFEDEINPKSLGVPDEAVKQLEAAGYKYNYDLQSLPVDVGAIAMANAGPNTNGSQFFIVTTNPQPSLNGKHTVFGKVVSGMDVVLKIQQGDLVKQITVNR